MPRYTLTLTLKNPAPSPPPLSPSLTTGAPSCRRTVTSPASFLSHFSGRVLASLPSKLRSLSPPPSPPLVQLSNSSPPVHRPAFVIACPLHPNPNLGCLPQEPGQGLGWRSYDGRARPTLAPLIPPRLTIFSPPACSCLRLSSHQRGSPSYSSVALIETTPPRMVAPPFVRPDASSRAFITCRPGCFPLADITSCCPPFCCGSSQASFRWVFAC